MQPPVTSATSEGAQGNFSKITFLKSVRSSKKDEVCHSFLVEIFTKSVHRGEVTATGHFPFRSDHVTVYVIGKLALSTSCLLC